MLDGWDAYKYSHSYSGGYESHGQSPLFPKPLLYHRGIGDPSDGPDPNGRDDAEGDVKLPPLTDQTA